MLVLSAVQYIYTILTLLNFIYVPIADPDGAILDGVFLGANWKRIPSFKKYQKVAPPNPVWNLQGNDLKKYYKSQFMTAAANDKMPVLGISDPFKRLLVLLSIKHPTEQTSSETR